ncbi:MAG TPA: serine hydrolase [Thermoanaerobaculia bacterium]|nr:serine hydrolase [Thermoanaerobaculia bacterium]
MFRRNSGGRALSALLLLSTLLPFAVPARAASVSKAEVSAYADRLLAEAYPADEPGAAAIVVLDGEVVLRKGYGLANVELQVPNGPEMVFELGSVTKQFTAAAILMLAERGQLRIEDDVTKYLPDYPTHGQKITIEHLLTHTSGIPSYTGLPEWIPRVREEMKLETLIGLFKDKPLEFTPGERWAYNNSAYVLLGAVIEKASGKSYEQFIEEEVFKPLGMKDSRYGHAAELVSRRAYGYGRDGENWKNADYLSMTQPYAAGSLLSTVDDLVLWDKALSGGTLLRKASLDRMFTAVKLNSGQSTRYGYGWAVFDWEGRRIVEHGGDIFGFTSYVSRVPQERLFIAILSNNEASDPRPEAIVARIQGKIFGSPLEDRKPLPLAAREMDEYVGVYRFDEETTRTITRDGDKLFSRRSGGGKAEIKAFAKDSFYFEESDSRLRFRRDAQGKITGVDFSPRYGLEGFGKRTDEPIPSERQAVKVDPAVYDGLVGEYELAPGFTLTITREGGQLFGTPTGQPKAELFPESENRFFLKVVDAQVDFERGPDGQATGLVLHQGGRDVPGKQVK